MKNGLMIILAFAAFTTQMALALSQKAESKPVHIQKIQIQLDSLKDCQAGTEDMRKLNLNPEEMCLIEVRGFENHKGILLESKVAGAVIAPYLANQVAFDGKLTYFKKDLPQEGSVTVELQILSEKISLPKALPAKKRLAELKN